MPKKKAVTILGKRASSSEDEEGEEGAGFFNDDVEIPQKKAKICKLPLQSCQMQNVGSLCMLRAKIS